MGFRDQLKLDLAAIMADEVLAGRTVSATYSSKTANGFRGVIEADKSFLLEGYRDEYDFSIWVLDGALGTVTPKTQITVAGSTRRVLGVSPDGTDALIRIDIGAKYAGN